MEVQIGNPFRGPSILKAHYKVYSKLLQTLKALLLPAASTARTRQRPGCVPVKLKLWEVSV